MSNRKHAPMTNLPIYAYGCPDCEAAAKEINLDAPQSVAPPEIRSGEWMDALAKELRAEMNTLAKRAASRSDDAALIDAATACALAAVAQCVERTKESASIENSTQFLDISREIPKFWV